MLRVMVGFFQGMSTLAKPWLAWIGLLIAVNMIAPLFFLATLEAKAILAAFLIGAVVQMTLFGVLGFVRFLGIGHILVWVPLLAWLWVRLDGIDTATTFGRFILLVIVLDALSLVIDFVDVLRYLRGERTPALRKEDVTWI